MIVLCLWTRNEGARHAAMHPHFCKNTYVVGIHKSANGMTRSAEASLMKLCRCRFR